MGPAEIVTTFCWLCFEFLHLAPLTVSLYDARAARSTLRSAPPRVGASPLHACTQRFRNDCRALRTSCHDLPRFGTSYSVSIWREQKKTCARKPYKDQRDSRRECCRRNTRPITSRNVMTVSVISLEAPKQVPRNTPGRRCHGQRRVKTVTSRSRIFPQPTVTSVEFVQRCDRFSALGFFRTRSLTIPNKMWYSERFDREPSEYIMFGKIAPLRVSRK